MYGRLDSWKRVQRLQLASVTTGNNGQQPACSLWSVFSSLGSDKNREKGIFCCRIKNDVRNRRRSAWPYAIAPTGSQYITTSSHKSINRSWPLNWFDSSGLIQRLLCNIHRTKRRVKQAKPKGPLTSTQKVERSAARRPGRNLFDCAAHYASPGLQEQKESASSRELINLNIIPFR